jgi:rhamnosyltransferase
MLAMVPTYRPAPILADLIGSLVEQGLPVAVIDDASPCTSDPLLAEIARMDGVRVLRNSRNAGIARSLNQGLRLAAELGCSWLLTVDQDSVIPPDLARILAAAGVDPRIGVIAPETICDASGALRYPTWEEDGLLLTHEVFQTGALWRVAAIASAGGFDEGLAIDGVDAAACLRLREEGYRVALARGLELRHQVGDGRQVRVLGRQVLMSNHSAQRRYTIVRNRIRLAPAEFRQSPVHAWRTIRRVAVQSALAVTLEDDRGAKARAVMRALTPRRKGAPR